MILLVMVVVLIALAVAAVLGLLPDTRDTGYSMGPLHRRRDCDQPR
jgi:hypothetical protein